VWFPAPSCLVLTHGCAWLPQDVSPLLLSEGGLQEGSWARLLLAESLLDSTGAWGPECVPDQLRSVAPQVVELLQGAIEG